MLPGCCCGGGIPKRFMLLFMVFLGFMTMYALRVNLNVAIGAMVNNHTVIEGGRAVRKVRWNGPSKRMPKMDTVIQTCGMLRV